MSRGTILISAAMAQKPREAGHTWVFLQYLLGFRRLGWDVLFLDQLDSSVCRNDAGDPCTIDDSVHLRYFLDVMRQFGLADSFSLICDGGERVIGVQKQQVLEKARRCAFLMNVMGYLSDEQILSAVPRKVFLDIDPGFGQMWCELGLHNPFKGHDLHVTIGQNIGQAGCRIPVCGIDWITTAQPIVLDLWRADHGVGGESFTSIGAWRGPYGSLEYRGEMYGLRCHEFRRFISMPRVTGCKFEIALDIHPAETADLQLLRENGWNLADPRKVAVSPDEYQRYIRGSRAEFLISKNIYVKANSGWFSDRSICYLASGRPVVAQDTGLRELYPNGEGLLLFSTLDEAAEAVRSVASDPRKHERAARAIAEELFDSDKVLGRLLTRLAV
jgi:hypothetical protein